MCTSRQSGRMAARRRRTHIPGIGAIARTLWEIACTSRRLGRTAARRGLQAVVTTRHIGATITIDTDRHAGA